MCPPQISLHPLFYGHTPWFPWFFTKTYNIQSIKFVYVTNSELIFGTIVQHYKTFKVRKNRCPTRSTCHLFGPRSPPAGDTRLREELDAQLDAQTGALLEAAGTPSLEVQQPTSPHLHLAGGWPLAVRWRPSCYQLQPTSQGGVSMSVCTSAYVAVARTNACCPNTGPVKVAIALFGLLCPTFRQSLPSLSIWAILVSMEVAPGPTCLSLAQANDMKRGNQLGI